MPLLKYCLPLYLVFFSLSAQSQDVAWMTWEEAAKANEKEPRKIFVDIYTNWCSWCKRMDATTFKEVDIVTQLNTKFYPVKLNAEQKESIFWKGEEFIWVPSGRDGYNQLAFDLADGQLSYPTFIILDQEYSRILASPGYKDGATLIKELKFAAEEHYKATAWETYKAKAQ